MEQISKRKRIQRETLKGYYGDEGIEDAISGGKAIIDCYIKEKVNKHLEKIKQWILNKVPLIYRTPLQLAQYESNC